MTSREKTIVQALIALAWADGAVEGPETSVVEGLLAGFDASPEEEQEILASAKKPPGLDDLKLGALNAEERDILLSNAALLVQADGAESPAEKKMLEKLARVLGLDADEARKAVIATRRPAPKQ
jgi:uncharacterized membrane protein YebE (DUF533 family)